MKVVIRRTKRFKEAIELFAQQHANLKMRLVDMAEIFRNEENWGTTLGDGCFQLDIVCELITSYSTRKKDTIEKIHYTVISKVNKTKNQSTVSLQSNQITKA